MKRDKFRKAIFAVAYSKTKEGIKYVVLKRKNHWKGWEFPKGKIEPFERKKKTVKREIKEEIGLDPLNVKRFPVKGKYLYHKKVKDRPGVIGQTYILFAVEVKYKRKIKIDPVEHYSGKWLSFDKAMKTLTWPNQRKCLKIVDGWVKKNK